MPNLKERTDLDTLYTDDGFGSPAADKILEKNQVEQIQTAIRGRILSSEKLNLSDFTIKRAENKKPTQITCPQGQMVAVHSSSQKKAFVAHFEGEVCLTCPLLQNVRFKGVNAISAFTCALIRSKSICLGVDRGV